MLTPSLQQYIENSQYLQSLAHIYSRYLLESYKKDPFIIVVNMHPQIMLNFMRFFTNFTIIINKRYDFSKDELFDLRNKYEKFEEYATLLKGLLYNYDEVDFKIKLGRRVTDSDLYYTPRKDKIKIIQEITLEDAILAYNLKKLPVVIIDATTLARTAWIPLNEVNDQPYEILKFKRSKNKMVKYDFNLGQNLFAPPTTIKKKEKKRVKHAKLISEDFENMNIRDIALTRKYNKFKNDMIYENLENE